jgi:hypothetical protein
VLAIEDAAGGMVEDPPCSFVVFAKIMHFLGIRDYSA